MTMDTAPAAYIDLAAAPEAQCARCCRVCGRPLRENSVCRAKASRARRPDPVAAFRHVLEQAPAPLHTTPPQRLHEYPVSELLRAVKDYSAWYHGACAGALGKERPSR